eukprot:2211700-Heterocapsa_arctica.AAC.1
MSGKHRHVNGDELLWVANTYDLLWVANTNGLLWVEKDYECVWAVTVYDTLSLRRDTVDITVGHRPW